MVTLLNIWRDKSLNKNYINSCLRWLANELVPFYKTRSLPRGVMDKLDTFYSSVSKSLDWYNITEQDMLNLGFLNWGDNDEDSVNVWFIPNWLSPIIPEGLTVYNTQGTPFDFDPKTASTEVLYGCLTFGILAKNRGIIDDGNI